ncbi:hypothetical protein KCP78_16515 [Salmonella enterica subsp. enterica]|nr:hypothetical protein KCP78_16515 [Salmonella enterica subsp. enterica]
MAITESRARFHQVDHASVSARCTHPKDKLPLKSAGVVVASYLSMSAGCTGEERKK